MWSISPLYAALGVLGGEKILIFHVFRSSRDVSAGKTYPVLRICLLSYGLGPKLINQTHHEIWKLLMLHFEVLISQFQLRISKLHSADIRGRLV